MTRRRNVFGIAYFKGLFLSASDKPTREWYTLRIDKSLRDVVERYDKSFFKLVSAIADTCIELASQIAGKSEKAGSMNIFGENQLEVDVWSNQLLIHELQKTELVSQIASEELDSVTKMSKGEFSIVLDPLDGSSNLASDNLLGTIVGVFRETDLPAKGRDLYASMYFLYGPFIQLVLAVERNVYIFFALGKGEKSARFVSTGEPHKIPSSASVYGIGGARAKWTTPVNRFVEMLEQRSLSLRYGGSFVGDYNQVLLKGGFFAYPELKDAPNGKYRLQFESNPIAFITAAAGGSSTNGTTSILDVEPETLSQRVPTYLGNPDLVSEFEKIYQKKIA